MDWRFENYLWQAGELLKFTYESMLVILVFYTGSSLNVNFLLPSLVLIHIFLPSMGDSLHDFISARGLTGTPGLVEMDGD